MVQEVKGGKINGNCWFFKGKDGDKYRYYCKYIKQGCRAALYLELTDGSKENCFVSDEDHSNHGNDEIII